MNLGLAYYKMGRIDRAAETLATVHKGNRDGIGARLCWTAGGKKRFRLKNNGDSYLSSHDPREVLGIGDAAKIDELEIHWPAPSRQIDRITSLPINRYVHFIEQKGMV